VGTLDPPGALRHILRAGELELPVGTLVLDEGRCPTLPDSPGLSRTLPDSPGLSRTLELTVGALVLDEGARLVVGEALADLQVIIINIIIINNNNNDDDDDDDDSNSNNDNNCYYQSGRVGEALHQIYKIRLKRRII
jgi:hypothetical protein